jgi:hypothetical protein
MPSDRSPPPGLPELATVSSTPGSWQGRAAHRTRLTSHRRPSACRRRFPFIATAGTGQASSPTVPCIPPFPPLPPVQPSILLPRLKIHADTINPLKCCKRPRGYYKVSSRASHSCQRQAMRSWLCGLCAGLLHRLPAARSPCESVLHKPRRARLLQNPAARLSHVCAEAQGTC